MSRSRNIGRILAGMGLTLAFGVAGASEPVGTLSRVEGVAVVSNGAAYVTGQEGLKLNEGDRLFVMEGGRAVIDFTDGCRYTLSDNELLTIGDTSTCASSAVGSYKADPYQAIVTDPGAAQATYQLAQGDERVGGIAGLTGAQTGALVGGAVLIGGAIAVGNDDNDGGTGPGSITTVPISPM